MHTCTLVCIWAIGQNWGYLLENSMKKTNMRNKEKKNSKTSLVCENSYNWSLKKRERNYSRKFSKAKRHKQDLLLPNTMNEKNLYQCIPQRNFRTLRTKGRGYRVLTQCYVSVISQTGKRDYIEKKRIITWD